MLVRSTPRLALHLRFKFNSLPLTIRRFKAQRTEGYTYHTYLYKKPYAASISTFHTLNVLSLQRRNTKTCSKSTSIWGTNIFFKTSKYLPKKKRNYISYSATMFTVSVVKQRLYPYFTFRLELGLHTLQWNRDYEYIP